jgi:dTDP-4-amino-4,6-dideoxygalactose transaminase
VFECGNSKSNYWFNAFYSKNKIERDYILEYTNNNGVMTRPFWTPMHNLSMYNECQKTKMDNTNWLYERLVCIPSSVIK